MKKEDSFLIVYLLIAMVIMISLIFRNIEIVTYSFTLFIGVTIGRIIPRR